MNSIIMRWAAYCVIASCLLLDHAIASNNETLLFEGDIVPTYKSISSVYGDDFANELVGKGYMEYNPDVVRGSSTGIDLWKQNWNNWKEMYVVNVYFSPAYNSTELRLVRRGVRRIQRKTGVIKFQWLFEYPEDGTPYIHVGSFGLDICKSFVGRDSSATNRFGQFLHIGPSCMTAGAIQHEMMHALGFYHEQSRPDRDNYVTINTENILEGNEHNFQKAAGIDSLGTAYDYNSVMHYDEYTFSIDPTLKTLDAKGNAVGQRTTMSSIDRIQIILLYQCKNDIVRSWSEYFSNNGFNKCTYQCKCGYKKRGCLTANGASDSLLCKGNLICSGNQCVKPPKN